MKVYVAIQYHEYKNDATTFGVSASFDLLLNKAKDCIIHYHMPCFSSMDCIQGTNWASLSVNDFHIDIIEEELELR